MRQAEEFSREDRKGPQKVHRRLHRDHHRYTYALPAFSTIEVMGNLPRASKTCHKQPKMRHKTRKNRAANTQNLAQKRRKMVTN
jgi:hypothetical protein